MLRAPRIRTCLSGKLVYGDGIFAPTGSFTQDCTIRDLSEGGAKIILSQRQYLPKDIYLIIAKYAVVHEAIIVWMNYPARGLRFINTYSLKAPLPDGAKFLCELQAQLGTRSSDT